MSEETTDTTVQGDTDAAATVDETQVNADESQETQQSTEQTTTDSVEDNGSTDEGAAPESYADFSVPEGMEMDKAAIEAFTPIAKELGLSQENAQKLVDLYAGQVNSFVKAQNDAIEATRTSWRETVAKDAVLGKDENVALAIKAVDKFGGPALKQALEDSGLGDHPEMLRAWYEVGKAISEDHVVTGRPDGAGFSKAMYPNSDHKD